MKVLILCGGLGTRLAGASELPKPMVPIGGKPIVWHIMKGFAQHGFRDFVLCLGYRSDLFKQYFLNLPVMVDDVTVDYGSGGVDVHHRDETTDWRVTLAETGYDTMTGARVRLGGRYLDAADDLFIVTYGDGVCDIDPRELIRFHRSHGRLATVTAVHPPGRFGELSMTGDRVDAFNEKPQASSGWISGGFFVFSRAVLDRLAPGPGLVLEQEPLQQLARDGELMAYHHEGFWFCLDTPRDYQQLTAMWSGGLAPWATWTRATIA